MMTARRLPITRFDVAIGTTMFVVIALIVLVIALGDHVDRKALQRQSDAARQTAVAVLQPSPFPTEPAQALDPIAPLPRPADGGPALAYLSGDPPALWIDSGPWIADAGPFTTSADGTRLAYVTADGTGIVVVETQTGVRRVYPCSTRCDALTWRPDFETLAVARAVTADSSSVRLMLLDLADGGLLPLQSDLLTTGERAVWSPDGDRVLFFDPGAEAGIVYDFALRRSFTHDGPAGQTGIFTPDGDRVVFVVCAEEGCQIASAGALAGKSRPLRGEAGAFVTAITGLAWPAGSDRPLALRAHALVWVDTADGAIDILVPAEPGVMLTALAVAPDGSRAVVQRESAGDGAQIVVYDLTSGAATPVGPGSAPAWIP